MDDVSGLQHAAWRSCVGEELRKEEKPHGDRPAGAGMTGTSVPAGPKWGRKEGESGPRVMSADNNGAERKT